MKSAAFALTAVLILNCVAETQAAPLAPTRGTQATAAVVVSADRDAAEQKIRAFVGPLLDEQDVDAFVDFVLETPANENGGSRLLRLLILLLILSTL